jgi:hypothetical protein
MIFLALFVLVLTATAIIELSIGFMQDYPAG